LLDVLVELKNGYLASISGGRATWSLQPETPNVFRDEDRNSWIADYGDTIAVVAQQWDMPMLLSRAQGAKINTISKLFFTYHAQIDPWVAFKQLSEHRFFDAFGRLQPVPVSGQRLADWQQQ
jgi:hypothetical protein